MMPDFNADPTEISGYEFATTSGKCIFSIFRPLTPFNKLAIKAMATTKNCSATKYWTLYYDINESGSWTTFDTFKSSPHPTDLDFGSGAGSEFRTIQFAVASTSDSATSVPQLRSLLFGFQAFTKRLRSWTFTVRAEGRDAEALLTNLHTSQDKDTLLLFYPSGDTGKTSYRVKIESLPENVHWDNHLKEGEVQVIVKEIFRG